MINKIKNLSIKNLLYVFFIIQPFLDTYYLYTDQTIQLFKFSPSTIVRFGFIGILLLYTLVKYRKTKKIIPLILATLTSALYLILHHLGTSKFYSLNENNFNYSLVQDAFYIARLLIPIFLIFIVYDFEINFSNMNNIIQISSFIIGFEIVFSNIFKISLASYTNQIIDDNIFSWFRGVYETNSFYGLASKAWFNFANQIAALLIIFMPFNIYNLFKKTSWLNISILILTILSGIMLGTRIALYGILLIFFIMLFLYFFDIIVNKRKLNINKKACFIVFFMLIVYAFIYPYTPAKNRQTLTKSITQNPETTEATENTTLPDLDSLLQEVKNSNNKNKQIEFLSEYYTFYRISPDFIENSYSYKDDPEFWLNILELPIEKRIDYRYLEQAIINRVTSINSNPNSILWGISYSRIQNIFNIERDFVLQYYALGIIGVIIFLIIPFIILPVIFGIYILKTKNINMENILLLLSVFLFLGIGYLSGNVVDSLTITIYIGLILGVMLSNFKSTGTQKKKCKVKKISIIALHLGFGGVENSICTLANMLSNYYNVEIISTYKLLDIPAFELNPKINVKYLIPGLKPNKTELKIALKNKSIINIVKEVNKSIKILYLKKYRLIKEIKKIDSDIIITTRDIHNKWIGKYARKNIIKIAEEHNHHNNNVKYINKLIHSLKNTDYLIPVSQELTDFYKEKLKNTKTKVIYIPHALDIFPNEISPLESNNIISIGRLSPEKGFDDLIDVFAKVCHHNNSANLKIIGDGPEKSKLEEKIKKANLTNRVELCGFKTKKEIEKYMLNSSLYVMTSHTESFGLVLIEAESYGLPILAFNSAQGANEIIKNNNNGYLIENRDINQMANKINLLLNNRDLRCKLGTFGRQDSMIYSQENVRKLWINFFENM